MSLKGIFRLPRNGATDGGAFRCRVYVLLSLSAFMKTERVFIYDKSALATARRLRQQESDCVLFAAIGL